MCSRERRILPSPAGEPVSDTAKSIPAAVKSVLATAKSNFSSEKSSATKSVISCFVWVCCCFWKARSCYCKVVWLPVYVLGSFPPFWFWLCCIRLSWLSSLLGLWFSLRFHWRSGFVLLWVYDRFVKYVRRQVPRKKASLCGVSLLFLKMLLTPCLWSSCQVPWTVICFVPQLIRCWCIRPPPAVLMFLLSRILFIVCWWARLDTLASWVDCFPPPYPSVLCDVSCGFC